MCNIQHQITLSQYAINKIVTKSLHCKGSLTYFAYCKMQNISINIALRQEERIGVWILSFYILFIHHPSFSMDITYQFGPLRSHLDHGSTINDAKAAHISGTGLGQGEAAGSTAAPLSVLRCKSCEIVLTEQLQAPALASPHPLLQRFCRYPQTYIQTFTGVFILGEWNANSIW